MSRFIFVCGRVSPVLATLLWLKEAISSVFVFWNSFYSSVLKLIFCFFSPPILYLLIFFYSLDDFLGLNFNSSTENINFATIILISNSFILLFFRINSTKQAMFQGGSVSWYPSS